MGDHDMGRYITRPSVIILFLICLFIYYSLPIGDSEDNPPEDEEIRMRYRSRINVPTGSYFEGNSEKKKDRSNSNEELSKLPDELVLGSKRYKLYEKKKLNFKKAEAYCKKLDGRLARTEGMEEMQRLQTLLKRAKMVSDEMWIGVNKKKWKKHALKNRDHPAGINPGAMEGMSAMMMGGGVDEMCPALSSSTRALAPAMCLKELPFVCEFDKDAKPKKPNFDDLAGGFDDGIHGMDRGMDRGRYDRGRGKVDRGKTTAKKRSNPKRSRSGKEEI